MIDIDGSYGEGGGQLVRTAAALAAITGTPLRLSNARARRGRPGLAPQHLAAVRAVARLCDARCEGLALRATSFTLEPRALPAGGELRVSLDPRLHLWPESPVQNLRVSQVATLVEEGPEVQRVARTQGYIAVVEQELHHDAGRRGPLSRSEHPIE